MTFDFSFFGRTGWRSSAWSLLYNKTPVVFVVSPSIFSFQTSLHFVFLSVSKESIRTLICDFACRNDSIEKKKKKKRKSCCICVMIAFKWTPYKSMTASFVNNVPRGFWCKRVVLMVVCFFFLSLYGFMLQPSTILPAIGKTEVASY